MDLIRILNNDLEGMSDEEREFAKAFNEKIKNNIIDELVVFEGESLISKLKNNKEDFMDSIDLIYINGIKGYKNMSLKQLIDIYLSKKGEEAFISLIGNIE